ncbi:hypothetical protein GCM10027578_03820 [Spirosoma luteolum]
MTTTITPNLHWLTIDIPAPAFRNRLDQDTNRPGSQPSFYSRLMQIHQTAKTFALDAARQAGYVNPVVQIDELTDPPLADVVGDDQQVLIRFSVGEADAASAH